MFVSWFRELPVITRTYMTLSMLTTLGCGMDLISPFHLYLNFQLIISRFEFWRIITNFCYFGKFGISFMFHMFFLVHYCRLLEESSKFRGRSADFLWMFLFGCISMLIISAFTTVHFLGSSLTFMVVYVWGRRHHSLRMSFLGLFTFTAAYLPLVFLAMSILLSSPVKLDLIGIFVGHTYYFLEDVYPYLGGKRLLRAPAFIHTLFGAVEHNDENVDQREIQN
eukprot:c832_g1_i1.p1 GENE.c832_g1_i1~~c832_g1_i1.p1  ORF type:complete len:223 (-),score=44.86 c832_g1_i1:146-814(-)